MIEKRSNGFEETLGETSVTEMQRKKDEKKEKFLNVFKSNITTWSIISIRKVAIKIKLPGQISLRYQHTIFQYTNTLPTAMESTFIKKLVCLSGSKFT